MNFKLETRLLIGIALLLGAAVGAIVAVLARPGPQPIKFEQFDPTPYLRITNSSDSNLTLTFPGVQSFVVTHHGTRVIRFDVPQKPQ